MTNKIESVTEEQMAVLIAGRDEYLDIGRTTRPCNRELAEDAITKLYARLNTPRPEFRWYDSPEHAIIQGAIDLGMPGKEGEDKIFAVRRSVWWQNWFSHCQILRRIGVEYSEEETRNLEIWDQLFHNGHWYFVFETVCLMSERPTTLKVDNEGRLHNPEGIALGYKDGTGIYSWHGTTIPKEWILDPQKSLTPEIALKWENIEQRRCAAEILGWGKILSEIPHTIIDADPNPQIGTLIEATMPDGAKEQFLKVVCGTGRDFVLPVPGRDSPDCITTARKANAWTYNLDEKDFEIEVRT